MTYRRPSFRGVPFEFDLDSTTSGRRAVIHTYPGTDDQYIEELGGDGKSKAFRLVAYVIGYDWEDKRDALIDALETEGPGELVTPYLGTKLVSVIAWGQQHQADREGIAQFTITFGETTGPFYPAGAGVTGELAGLAADASVAESKTGFAALTQTLGVPEYARDAVMGPVNALQGVYDELALDGALEDVAAFTREASRLADDVLAVIAYPQQISNKIGDTIAGIRHAVGAKTSAFAIYTGLYRRADGTTAGGLASGASDSGGLFAETDFGTSPISLVAAQNERATQSLIAEVAIAESVRAAADITWPSLEEANAARATIAEGIDIATETATDAVIVELGALRKAMFDAVPPLEEQPPSLVEVELAIETPSLVLAYSLYDDRERGTEIAARNGVPDPSALPPGEPLEVLSR